MPTWGELLLELGSLKQEIGPTPPGSPAPSAHDTLRRKYLTALSNHTGRATIVYATAYLEPRVGQIPGEFLSVNLGDKQGFMEALSNIKGQRNLDLILTSPGGSAEAAEAIIDYLRTRFDHIRAVIPIAAMSAATMIALACDEILMGTHSQLGPIDPQFTISTPEGPRTSPAQAILDQFEMASQQIATDPKTLGAWMPLLRSFSPGLLAHCVHSREQAERFVEDELKAHMMAGDHVQATKVAKWFADFKSFQSHGRPVSRDDVERLKLNVSRLEDDQTLQDLVLSVHHAVRHTFADTGAVKIIENHLGRAYVEAVSAQFVVQQPPQAQPGRPPGSPAPAGLPPGKANRQQRRQAQRKGGG